MSDEQASLAHADLVSFDVDLFPFEPSASRVWQLRQNLTAHDAWYIALAESLDCPLFTLDTRLARAPGIKCPVNGPQTSEFDAHGRLRTQTGNQKEKPR